MLESALQTKTQSVVVKAKSVETGKSKNALFGFVISWVVFAVILTMVPISQSLTGGGRAALAVMGWATIIWLSNGLPLAVSGLMIPVLLSLTGAAKKLPEAFSGFTNDVTFLILGCFILAAVMQSTGLDKRIALSIVSRVKPRVGSVLKGIIGAHLVTAVLVPATNARGALFLPIIQGLNSLFEKEGEGARARKVFTMVGIGFASLASGTILMHSHMSNVIVAQTINQAMKKDVITWGSWAWMNWPLLGILVIMYYWVNWIMKSKNIEVPGGITEIKRQKEAMGKMTVTEWIVLVTFGIAIFLWATEQIHGYNMSLVALVAVMVLFIPGFTNLSWKRVQSNTLFGTWLLLCGSLSLVSAFSKTGVDKWIASHLVGLAPAWGWIGVSIFICVIVQISRLGIVSNVAAVTLLAPIVAAMAPMLGLNTVAFTMMVLNVDSYAFVLPISVTACLIAYGTEEFTFGEFVKVGAPITLMVILYMVFVMVPWYAVTGYPIWVAIH